LISRDKFVFGVACVSAGYYFFAAIFAFFPYREFKAIFHSSYGGAEDEGNRPPPQQPRSDEYTFDYQQTFNTEQKAKEQSTF
jgi:hypothetical protein